MRADMSSGVFLQDQSEGSPAAGVALAGSQLSVVSMSAQHPHRLQPLQGKPAGTLLIHEIYRSLQGESTFAGLPCVFIRLTACNLRCVYCDTAHAITEGAKQTVADMLAEIRRLAAPFGQHVGGHKLPLVELTGGEPLLQPNALPLMKALCDE